MKKKSKATRVVAFGHAQTPVEEWEEYKAFCEALGFEMTDEDRAEFLAMIAEQDAKEEPAE